MGTIIQEFYIANEIKRSIYYGRINVEKNEATFFCTDALVKHILRRILVSQFPGNYIYTVELFRDLWLYKASGLYILNCAILIIIIIIIIIGNNRSKYNYLYGLA